MLCGQGKKESEIGPNCVTLFMDGLWIISLKCLRYLIKIFVLLQYSSFWLPRPSPILLPNMPVGSQSFRRRLLWHRRSRKTIRPHFNPLIMEPGLIFPNFEFEFWMFLNNTIGKSFKILICFITVWIWSNLQCLNAYLKEARGFHLTGVKVSFTFYSTQCGCGS